MRNEKLRMALRDLPLPIAAGEARECPMPNGQ